MENYTSEPIAIVGSACRFPGESSSPSKLWTLLREPRDVLAKIPPVRFDPEGFYNEDGEYHGSSNVKESYMLTEDHRVFDAQFFKIKPVEAHSIDPQQRILMETVYESIEAAGFAMEKMQGSDTAVYVGLMCEEYSNIVAGDVDQLPTYTATATGRSIMSNRISYFFDWHGPCMTIDTACSSSLIAVHQAVETLRNGTSRVAIAAGANLLLSPMGYITESKLHMLSPGSRSRMWDADADGYARGDGVAAVVLKKLSDAIRDGDHIESIIRDTGVNQDGRTTGITMPSSTAQEALIRRTYSKAGLDLTDPFERCQYFEAHGTGTPAGDPIEASAIQKAFFGADNTSVDSNDILYVGSIKTVIGHTEGPAGIAALMKASLAIQHSIIPPNMLFNRLSPAVEPFYKHLEIATAARSWPELPEGIPRRASVNSFGFGGTNAHAIVEQYVPGIWDQPQRSLRSAPSFLPICLSAASEKALFEQARRLSVWLENNSEVSLTDLAWTLATRRSKFQHRWFFSACSVAQLRAKIDKRLGSTYEPINLLPSLKPKILGIFTGQGAQWAAMGRSLIIGSNFVSKIVDCLEVSLSLLPDAPTWSLREELLVGADKSRIAQAALSQPLCTAVQVILVEMLKASGIGFEAVVGHSSGEIGAAYAAGLICAEDAIRIAYYRGLHSSLAKGTKGQKGAMLAVGTSVEDAQEFCAFEEMQGRICVAACNSSSSVTLSGDSDAVKEAESILQDEGRFVRLLRVDTAYHSHHMLPPAGPYVESMRSCHVRVLDDRKGEGLVCSWFSSVREDQEEMKFQSEGLDGEYWRDNMVKPVLFAQALKKAIDTKGPFDLAFEVGPHPALQGPALQTIQEVQGNRIPYTGVLSRGVDDVESFADALGYLWSHLSPNSDLLQLESFDATMSGEQQPNVIKNLPPYAFDHGRVYWRESRLVKATRTRKTPYHDLLGVCCPDGTDPTLLRWKNLLSPKEIPWLGGHMVQGQIIFPAAGYLSMAIDACRILVARRGETLAIKGMDILDFVIGKGIIFDDRSLGVETLLTLTLDEEYDENARSINGTIRFYAGLANSDVSSLPLRCSCRVHLNLEDGALISDIVEGSTSLPLLPPRSEQLVNGVNVDAKQFYANLAEVGYEYSGLFQGLSELKRTLDAGTGVIANPARQDPLRSPTVHPAMIDCTIQAVLLAFCFPGDGKLYALHVPTKIRRVSIDLPLLERETLGAGQLPVDSIVDSNGTVSGDAHLFAKDGETAMIQMHGIEVVPLTPPTPEQDAQLFWAYELGVAQPDGNLMVKGRRATDADYELAEVAERICYHYLKNLLAELTPEDIEKSAWHHKRLVNFARKTLGELRSGQDPHTNPHWYDDTDEDIAALMYRFRHKVEMKLVGAVGRNLAAAVRGETSILEHMMEDNVLHDFYAQCLGFDENSHFLAEAVSQITHRFPHMNIIEVGAGTGGATKIIIPHLGNSFSSYTFTDISGGFFPKAREVFSRFDDRMDFRVLDAEKDVVEQGFVEHSYDVVVASLVLHATRDLYETMRNVRRLLKPGGYVVMLELTNVRPIRTTFAMSGLPGWWLGDAHDGREFSPCVSASHWNTVLQKTGFSTVDAVTPDLDPEPWPFNVLVAQALDDRVTSLRRPLSAPCPATPAAELIILGGTKLQSSLLAGEVGPLVSQWFKAVRHVSTPEDLLQIDMAPMSTVLSLTDLDSPVFKGVTEDRLEAMKRLIERSRNVVWVTRDARAGGDPYMNMTIGWARTALEEMPQLRLQFLDFTDNAKMRAELVAQELLRLQILEQWSPVDDGYQLLWSIEPEIVIEEGDRILIPRLRASKERNDRYNSTRRTVLTEVDPQSTRVVVDRLSGGNYELREEQHAVGQHLLVDGDDRVAIEVLHSLLLPLKLSESVAFYASVGMIKGAGKTALTLSKSLHSSLELPKSWVFPMDDTEPTPQLLARFAGAIIASRIVDFAESTSATKLIAHNIPPFVAKALSAQAEAEGITVIQTRTGGVVTEDASDIVEIHPRTSELTLSYVLPTDAHLLVDLSGVSDSSPNSNSIGNMISAVVGKNGFTLTSADLVETDAIEQRTYKAGHFSKLSRISSIISELSFKPTTGDIPVNIVSLSELPTLSAPLSLDTALTWAASGPQTMVSVKAENVDKRFSFRPDRTYLLVGLSGQMGKSICTWMVRHGAKYVVLTSRQPVVDEGWLRKVKALGGTGVQFIANDVTDKSSVAKLVSVIRETMPPLAGFANGAMVLQDTPIRDMTAEVLNRVLRPKVDGSRHLDDLLADEQLDFAIFFSSMASVLGNHGQSNYTAANLFMNGLAARRRRRGQPASVIAIGSVIGIGYMARELTQKEILRIKERGYTPLSEREVHQLFCEGILAGRPRSDDNSWAAPSPEVVCGVRIAQPGEERPIRWMANPMVGHAVIKRINNKKEEDGSSTTMPVKASLLLVKTKEAAFAVIRDAFVTRLQGMLQSDSALELHLAADELGVDSLVAVDIRSWFLRELQVDLPVLKILGGASVGDMLEFALDNMSSDLMPNVDATSPFNLANVEEMKAEATAPPLANGQPGIDTEKLEVPTGGPPPVLVSYSEDSSSDGGSRGDLTSSAESNESGINRELTPLSTPGLELGPIINADSIHQLDKTRNVAVAATVARTEPMSFGQSRFWFLQQYLETKTAFNIATTMAIQGDLRVQDLARAVLKVGQHHESLRTKFTLDEQGRPVQKVMAKSKLELQHRTISGPVEAQEEYQRMVTHVYSLETGDTMQISVLSDSTNGQRTHYLTIGYHHINMDGISLGVLLSDLHKAYHGARLTPSLQFPDFSTRQRSLIASGDMKTELAFWKAEFDTLPPVLPVLPFSLTKTRRALVHYDAHKVDVRVSGRVAAQIKDVVKTHRVSPFHVYLATFRALLSRLVGAGGGDDLVIGMADANRTERGAQEAIGMYLNLLPLRFQSSISTQSFAAAIKEAQSKVRKALAHSRVPFDVLLEELQPPRSSDASPLFQVFIDYRQPLGDSSRVFGCKVVSEEYVRGDTAYDVVLDIIDTTGGDAHVQFTVPKLLYSSEDAGVLSRTFMDLLDEFTKQPGVGLTEVPLYSEKEVKKSIELGRGPAVEAEWSSIPLRIQDIMAIHVNNVAVRDGHGQSLTYDQLGSKVKDVAQALSDAGVTSGSVVTVLQQPRADWAVSVLAILQLDAVYVPLDVRLPLQRLALIINDSKPLAILFHTETKGVIDSLGEVGIDLATKAINIEDCASRLDHQLRGSTSADADRPAFILYTSGSTGAPKGVVLKQSNLLNQVEATVREYGIKPEWTILQQTAHTFDLSMFQLLLAVTSGASLYIVPRHLRGDPLALTRVIAAENITFTCTTPSEYSSWLHSGDRSALLQSQWQKAVSCGETLTTAVQAAFRSLSKPDLSVINAYGPCEVTFVSHGIELDYMSDLAQESAIPIGKTLPNFSTFVLDESLRPLPVGVIGQIAIGGASVAQGYLGQPKLTLQSFVVNTFATERDIAKGWTTMYLTGDRGALRSDGSLLWASRMTGQTQIKLRGMRFDLQDVEANLIAAAKGSIADAVVSLRGGEDGLTESQFLVAHVSFATDRVPQDPEAFCRNLVAELPLSAHMKPSLIVPLMEMPLTISSKIDRSAIQQLSLPSAPAATEESDVLSTALHLHHLSEPERQMYLLWQSLLPAEVLRSKPIVSQSDFFGAGGDSLLLARLQTAIKDKFNITIPLIKLFDTSTLGGMAAQIDGAATVAAMSQSSTLVDWQEQTKPAPVPVNEADESALDHGCPPRNIVLTGATGFLGRSILGQLLTQPSVQRVDCIAVRDASTRDLPAIFHDPRVHVYDGDLSRPNLGLSPFNASAIFGRADAVIHNAADVSFLKSYASLRPVNVESTKTITSLVLPRRTPLHFVSTAGVAHLVPAQSRGQLGGVGEVSVAGSTPPQDGSDGYVATKWAGERFLERTQSLLLAEDKRPLPLWIHRPSSVMGEGASETDLMTNVLKYSIALQALPIIGGSSSNPQRGASTETSESFLDFVDVDTAARSVVRCVVAEGGAGLAPEQIRYSYHSGEYIIPLQALMAAESEGDPSVTATQAQGLVDGFGVLPLAEWTERAKAAGMNDLVVALLTGAVGDAGNSLLDGQIMFPRLLKGAI
ncbi:Pseudouridine-metabolizing protein [Verticillium dahliae VDG2]|nr:Pseudouridine-metabolizing protein [Verticillium dahliae VDG2]